MGTWGGRSCLGFPSREIFDPYIEDAEVLGNIEDAEVLGAALQLVVVQVHFLDDHELHGHALELGLLEAHRAGARALFHLVDVRPVDGRLQRARVVSPASVRHVLPWVSSLLSVALLRGIEV